MKPTISRQAVRKDGSPCQLTNAPELAWCYQREVLARRIEGSHERERRVLTMGHGPLADVSEGIRALWQRHIEHVCREIRAERDDLKARHSHLHDCILTAPGCRHCDQRIPPVLFMKHAKTVLSASDYQAVVTAVERAEDE